MCIGDTRELRILEEQAKRERDRRVWRTRCAAALMREVEAERREGNAAEAHAREVDELRRSLALARDTIVEGLSARAVVLRGAALKARDALRAMRANTKRQWPEVSGPALALRALEEALG